MSSLLSFPLGFKALVIGSTGEIGRAFVELLESSPRCASVRCLHRHSEPALDLASDASILACVRALSEERFHLVIIATGVLHTSQFGPEKKMGDLDLTKMQQVFQVNTFGPTLLIGHLVKLLDKQRGVMAVLSAKVGSIGDNRMGGWYSYRASKAALNMMIKTAAIEVRRTQPVAVLLALHPGTVVSRLSQPFGGESVGRPALDAASDMLKVIDAIGPEQSGSFVSYSGEVLPW
jgi:NAD(P)-dependent dehydrogenase (short-subunit alcohol dehydrogenase family)